MPQGSELAAGFINFPLRTEELAFDLSDADMAKLEALGLRGQGSDVEDAFPLQ